MSIRVLIILVSLLGVNNLFAQPTQTSGSDKKPAEKESPAVKPNQKTIDWGDWNKKYQPHQRFGVGIKGRLQHAISELDKSNLLNDTTSISSTAKSTLDEDKKRKDIKKMKQELRALEEKVKQEIENNEDY